MGRYHKRTLFRRVGAGDLRARRPAADFDAGGLRVGVAICYDVEFPELIRAYARDGVQLVVVPTALMAPHDRVARLVVPVRALENQIFLGYANRCGQEPGLDFVGLSRICGPRGQILAEAGRTGGGAGQRGSGPGAAGRRARREQLSGRSRLSANAFPGVMRWRSLEIAPSGVAGFALPTCRQPSAHDLVELVPRNLARARPARPDVSLGDDMTSGQIAVGHDAGAGEAIHASSGAGARLGLFRAVWISRERSIRWRSSAGSIEQECRGRRGSGCR
jgi:hypothetical protein